MGGLLAVTLALVLVLTPVLSVRTIEIEGAGPGVTRRAQQAATEQALGSPLARVDVAEVEQAVLAAAPSVAKADVQRVPPSTLRVSLVLREPVLTFSDRAARTTAWVDDQGTVYNVGAKRAKGTPVVTVGRGVPRADRPQALRDAAEIVTALPEDLRARVREVQIRTGDDIRFTVARAGEVRWGGPSDTARKVDVLQALLGVEAKVYDVSAPDLPTTRR
jgi:cell division protein FtsQ